MYYRDISKIIGIYLLGFTVALGIPCILAAYYEHYADPLLHPQPHSTKYFIWSMVISFSLGALLYFFGRHSGRSLYRREGLISVILIWFFTPLIAGLPFYLSGTLKDPSHCFFEATSGFTTTGATVMQAKRYNEEGEEIPIQKTFCGVKDTVYTYYGTIEPVRDVETGKILYEGIEAVGKALLFWRSFMQWLGGMGIVVLFVAILPALGVGGKVLFQAEVPGPVKDSLTPRIKETAINLWKIYLGLTVLQVVVLSLTNSDLSWLDLFSITFSTMSTGGFTIKNASIGAFNNVYTDWVVLIFMVLASINFSLYFYSLKGKLFRIYEPEFLTFIFLVLLSCGVASFMLIGTEKIALSGENMGIFGVTEAIRHGSFQVISAMTTTGFVTVDYDYWPFALQAIMLLVMFVGGMSGSTAGGMKVVRQLMLFRIAQYKVESIFRPQTVRRFKVGDREVDQGASIMVLTYFLLVVVTAAFATLLFIMDSIDPETSLSLSALLINNIGIGFRMASPTESLAFMSDFSLIFSSLLMVLGRLEFFAVLAVMVPAFWQQDK